MPNPIPNDDTHIGYLSNPSGLKKASGDSSSGVDAATLNAVAANLVVNGMIDLSALRMLESNTLSKLNVDNTASLKSGKGEQGRSEKISELALGVSSTNFPSMKVDSLGDIMFELMVLMIQSTTERRQLEREMRTTLTVAQVDQSKEIAKDIMKKMEMDVGQMKMEAWGQFAIAATGA
ncbi:MAG: hypothetical protein LBI69_02430, partial [Puniceicoccales bacterium]|nr:hypothetical protein [Puniceicoccales bacterium]